MQNKEIIPIVTILIILPMMLINQLIDQNFMGFIIKVVICFLFSSAIIAFLGLKKNERHLIFIAVKNIYTKLIR